MKKTIGLFVLSGAMVFGLSACSSDSTTSTNSSYENSSSSNYQDEGLTVKEYAVKIIPKLRNIEGDLTNLQQNAFDLADDPTLMFDSDYQSLVQESSDQFYNDIQDIKDIDIGENSDADAIHQLVLESMDNFEFVAVNFPDAVKNADIDLIKQCTTHLQQGSSFMQQASDKVE